MSTAPKNKKAGFSLIEIIVVVAIIGMISAVVMISLATARAKGRDAKRKSDMSQLQKALELYQLNFNAYPITGPGNSCNGSNFWGGISAQANSNFKQRSGANGWIPNLAPAYVSVLPIDPLGRTDLFSGYHYCSDGVSYKLIDNLTGPESFPIAGEPFYDPKRPGWAWMVCSGQVACDNW
jgi:prepilin-type N-terminal cleavage/methylation domain-containing protein